MKANKRKALAAKRARIAAGTNNGWLNFALEIDCKNCDYDIAYKVMQARDMPFYCSYIGSNLDEKEGLNCVREAYRRKQV